MKIIDFTVTLRNHTNYHALIEIGYREIKLTI